MSARPVLGLDELQAQVGVWTTANEQVVSVAPSLEGLLADRGLRRGSVASVRAAPGASGVSTLACALVTHAVQGGAWCAVVSVPDFGAAGARASGLELSRCILVPDTGPDPTMWGTVVAAFIDACDVIVTRAPSRASASVARRLASRARERRSVLMILGEWPEPADIIITVDAVTWCGLGDGWGHLTGRRLDVRVGGRGAAARERRHVLHQDDTRIALAPPTEDEQDTSALPALRVYGSAS